MQRACSWLVLLEKSSLCKTHRCARVARPLVAFARLNRKDSILALQILPSIGSSTDRVVEDTALSRALKSGRFFGAFAYKNRPLLSALERLLRYEVQKAGKRNQKQNGTKTI